MGGVLLGLGLLAGLRVTAEGACPTAAAVEAHLQQMLPQLQICPRCAPTWSRSLSCCGSRCAAKMARYFRCATCRARRPVRQSGRGRSGGDYQRLAKCPARAAAPPGAASRGGSAGAAAAWAADPLRTAAQVDAGVAVALAAAASGATVGGMLVIHAAPRGKAFGVRLGLTGTRWRREALGDSGAGAEWTRLQLEVGPRYRLRPGRLVVDLHAQAAAALVEVAGQGFAANYQSWGWDVGVGGGLRVGLPLRWALPWVGVAGTGYLRTQQLRVLGQPDTGQLPRFDVLVALGFSAGRWQ